MPNTIEENNEVCEGYALGKNHRQPLLKGVAWREKKALKLIHTNIYGPIYIHLLKATTSNLYSLLMISQEWLGCSSWSKNQKCSLSLKNSRVSLKSKVVAT